MNEIISTYNERDSLEDQSDKEMLNKVLFSQKPRSKQSNILRYTMDWKKEEEKQGHNKT